MVQWGSRCLACKNFVETNLRLYNLVVLCVYMYEVKFMKRMCCVLKKRMILVYVKRSMNKNGIKETYKRYNINRNDIHRPENEDVILDCESK